MLCFCSRKNISYDGSKTSLLGKSPLTARRLQNAEQSRPSSGGARLRHNFASDNSVVNAIDVHVTCDDSQNVIIACVIHISNISNEDLKKSSS